MPTLVEFKPAAAVIAEEQNNAEIASDSLLEKKDKFVTGLSARIDRKWDIAKSSKRAIEDQFLANLRARKRQYSSDMLAALKQMYGPEYEPVYAPVIETKCSAAESWIKEIFFQKGERPWDIQPTPVPELPPTIESLVRAMLSAQIISGEPAMPMAGAAPGMPTAPMGMPMEQEDSDVSEQVEGLMPEATEKVAKVIENLAKRSAEIVRKKIEDMFVQGEWNRALNECIYDVVTFGTMIMKGPFIKKINVRKRDFDPATSTWKTEVKQVLREYWARVNPFDLYPLPGTTNPQNGDFIEVIRMTRRELSDLRNIPGWDKQAITEVLRAHRSTGFVEQKNTDSERLILEGKESLDLYESENIECIKYHGSAPGYELRQYGMSEAEVPDEEKEYDIVAWKIKNWVIKAIINPDPLGARPYFTAGFRQIPDSFWHVGVPQLAEGAQKLANSIFRAIAINVGIASGPQIEVDIERILPGEKLRIWPYRVWQSTNQQLREGQAVNFFQPQIVVAPLMEAFELCLRMADEDTGVPRYAHGDPRTTGATETASGLSMMMSQSAKGIKMVVKNIDEGVISKSVEFAYNHILQYEKNINVIGDLQVVATGSYALMAREQQAIRRTEFLVQTANPFDMQVLGQNGRAELLRQALKSLDIDPEKVIKEDDELERMAAAQGTPPANDAGLSSAQPQPPMGMAPVPEQPPPPAPVEVDSAGAPVAGRNNQLFESGAGVTP